MRYGELRRQRHLHTWLRLKQREFEQQLRASLNCPVDLLVSDLSPELSVHTGASLVDVGVMTRK